MAFFYCEKEHRHAFLKEVNVQDN